MTNTKWGRNVKIDFNLTLSEPANHGQWLRLIEQAHVIDNDHLVAAELVLHDPHLHLRELQVTEATRFLVTLLLLHLLAWAQPKGPLLLTDLQLNTR